MNNQVQSEEPTEERHVIKTVSMYPEQWTAVEWINRRFGFGNTSIALRYIVNEFRRTQTDLFQSEQQPS